MSGVEVFLSKDVTKCTKKDKKSHMRINFTKLFSCTERLHHKHLVTESEFSPPATTKLRSGSKLKPLCHTLTYTPDLEQLSI